MSQIVSILGLAGSVPNTLEIHTKTPVVWYARPDTANANLDGTGVLAAMLGDTGSFAVKFNRIRILSEDSTPAETYRLFLATPDSAAPRLVYETTINTQQTVEALDDFIIPVGSKLYAASDGGEEASIWLFGGRYD